MFDLKNKVAIVTGARRGIGRGIALMMAKAGAKVVVSDLDENDCQKVVEEIKEIGSDGLAVKCDVTNKKEIEEMVRKTVKKFGKIDILVNNAGIAPFKPFLAITEEDWDKVLAVNLKGYYLCAQAVAKEMIKNGWGRIINIASVAMGQVGFGFPNLTHYCASKGGIVAFTEALALELTPKGINVNAISPGAIDTEMAKPVTEDEKVRQAILSQIPKGRIGQPEDIAAAAVFLASEEADYITGATLVVDGGWLAG
ncbi:MAG: 3-oxoacyl-ACP reductase FabG [Patescibacteria group bacterium]|nr:3-oxoacyl-ACP reductase FabG [Patescibacteria group bacterium]